MLSVNHITKRFDTTLAVNDVSFDIKEGEIFSLIGPNSSGKTTLVKTILGLIQPTKGSISVNGKDVTKKPEEAKALLGYIPDEPTIWNFMTGEEYLMFTHALYRNKTPPHTQIKDLLSTFNLAGTEKKFFDDYSRGNKQKFTILAALSHQPKVLLIDEPIVGLDPTGAEIAKNLFVDFAKNGGAVLLVTHTLSVAEEISHRIGLLKNGSLIAVGTLSELREKASLPADASLDLVYAELTKQSL